VFLYLTDYAPEIADVWMDLRVFGPSSTLLKVPFKVTHKENQQDVKMLKEMSPS